MQKTLFAKQPNTEQQRSGMASKRTASRTVKRMEQDVINISDSEGTITISDAEDEAGMSSSEDEAPPPKRRQIGGACEPSIRASPAKVVKSDLESDKRYALPCLQAKLSMAKEMPRQRAPALRLSRLQVTSWHAGP